MTERPSPLDAAAGRKGREAEQSRLYHSGQHLGVRSNGGASMRNGSGDEHSIVFSPAGAYVRGFDHESPMSPYVGDGPWPGVLDEVPEVFRPCVEDPAFSDEDGMPHITVCMWRETGDGGWRAGTIDFPDEAMEDPDGAGYLFHLLVDRSPEAFSGGPRTTTTRSRSIWRPFVTSSLRILRPKKWSAR